MSTITSVTFDKTSYAPGDTITVTVVGAWEASDTLTITTPDGATGTASVPIIQPVTGADTGKRTWAVKSNTGTQAVLTATA